MTEESPGKDVSENPFLEFEQGAMHQSSPSSVLLRDLVLHLHRGHGSLDLRGLLRYSGQPCARLALSMLAWFTEHGDECPQFVRVAIAVERDTYFF